MDEGMQRMLKVARCGLSAGNLASILRDSASLVVLRAKRIDISDASRPMPRVHPTVVRTGRGTVRMGPGAGLGRHCQLHVRKGAFVMDAGSSLRSHVHLYTGGGHICLGKQSTIVSFSLLYGNGGVTIGDRVMVGNHCLISALDHTYPNRDSVALSPMYSAPIVIDNDAWIGAYSLVLPGVTIGEGAIVAAHSVVKEDVRPYTVVGGQPAKLLRVREAG